jgi:hypothetical protein
MHQQALDVKEASLSSELAKKVVFNDLRRPHEWYPIARSMKRKIVMHVGPTNSGKTHSALEALKKAEGGVYCGPLRLLAEQVFEKLNTEGVPCNLMTGEKVIELDRIDERTRLRLASGGDEAMASLYELYIGEKDGAINAEEVKESLENGLDRKSEVNSETGASKEVKMRSPTLPSSKPLHGGSRGPSPVSHVSCTIEMADVSRRVKVALIDEYQMIGDESRGWAWTRALLGIPAEEIHLCGDLSSIDLVKELLKPTGDEIQVQEYERLSQLSIASRSLGSAGHSTSQPVIDQKGRGQRVRNGYGSSGNDGEVTNLQEVSSSSSGRTSSSSSCTPTSSRHTPIMDRTKIHLLPPALQWIGKLSDGDAVIVFSRLAVFQHKRLIESTLGRKVAVVYGSLPPETRTQQAKQFNDPSSDTSILVATDAIGLGLNLNIGRIVFSTVKKFDGVEKRDLRPPEVRQIGGRAGRFNSRFPVGTVTSIHPRDLPLITSAFKKPIEPQYKAGLLPMFEHLELFEEALQQMIRDQQEASGSYTASGKKRKKSKRSRDALMLKAQMVENLQAPTEPILVSASQQNPYNSKTYIQGESSSDAILRDSSVSLGENDEILFSTLETSPSFVETPSSTSKHSRVLGDSFGQRSAPSVSLSRPPPVLKLGDILEMYEQVADLSGRFFLCNIDAHRTLSGAVDHLELTLKEKYTFVLAPTKANDPMHLHYLGRFATDFSKGIDVLCPSLADMVAQAKEKDMESQSSRGGRSRLDHLLTLDEKSSKHDLESENDHRSMNKSLQEVEEWISSKWDSSSSESASTPASPSDSSIRSNDPPIVYSIPMQRWEQMYRIVDLYLWLSYRFEGFDDVLTALKTKVVIEANIARLLDTMPSPYHINERRMVEEFEGRFRGQRSPTRPSFGGPDFAESKFKRRGRGGRQRLMEEMLDIDETSPARFGRGGLVLHGRSKKHGRPSRSYDRFNNEEEAWASISGLEEGAEERIFTPRRKKGKDSPELSQSGAEEMASWIAWNSRHQSTPSKQTSSLKKASKAKKGTKRTPSILAGLRSSRSSKRSYHTLVTSPASSCQQAEPSSLLSSTGILRLASRIVSSASSNKL